MSHQYHAKGIRPLANQTTRQRRIIDQYPQKKTQWLLRWEREFKSRWVVTSEGYYPAPNPR